MRRLPRRSLRSISVASASRGHHQRQFAAVRRILEVHEKESSLAGHLTLTADVHSLLALDGGLLVVSIGSDRITRIVARPN